MTETEADTEKSIDADNNQTAAKRLAIRQPFESALKYNYSLPFMFCEHA